MNIVRMKQGEARKNPDLDKRLRLLGKAKEMAGNRLSVALKAMLDKADDALFELAEKSETDAAQRVYFDAMREVRIKRDAIEGVFEQRFVQCFDEGVKSLRDDRTPAARELLGMGAELGLVDDELVEQEIAASNMAAKIAAACREELFALDQRVGVLIGVKELQECDNPIGPKAVCSAIKDACEPIESGIEIRLILLKLFDRYVAGEVKSVYQQINQYLLDHRVLPQLPSRVAKAGRGSAVAATPGSTASAQPLAEPQALLLDTLQQLVTSGPVQGVRGTDSAMGATIHSLTRLQQAGDVQESSAGGIAGASGVNVIHDIKSNGVVGSMGAADGNTVDIVAMLFDYILDDKELPDTIRSLIGRLQIPILKVALLDREFFAKKSHPARRLLNGIAEAAVTTKTQEEEAQLLTEVVERLVHRVLDTFEDDVSLFSELAEEFETFVNERERLAMLQAEQAARVEQGRQRLERAKIWVRDAVDERVKRQASGDTVWNFLVSHWKRLLITLYAEEGEDSGPLQAAVRTMDDLIWSVGHQGTIADRRKLSDTLPELIKDLQAGMDRISMPSIARDSFMSKLARLHAKAIQGDAADTVDSAMFDVTAGEIEEVPLEEMSADAFFDEEPGSLADPLAETIPNPAAECESSVSAENAELQSLAADPFDTTEPDMDLSLSPDAADQTCELVPETDEQPAPAIVVDPAPDVSARPAATLAEAAQQKLDGEGVVVLEQVIAETGIEPAALSTQDAAADATADALKKLFDAGLTSGEEFGRLMDLDELEVEELTITDLAGDGSPQGDADEHISVVDQLSQGAWLEFTDEYGTTCRGRLTWINAATDTYLFTDRSGHKLPDRSRNGLVAEFRRGSARLAEAEVPLFDRAVNRLLDGLGR